MGINDEISYQWPYAWDADNMASEKPVVNRLLKAMIEKDIVEMEKLFSLGATIEEIDEASFQRALFHLLGDYPVIKCLVDHGFVGYYYPYMYMDKCVEPETYFWGITIRAWYLGNYDVFELLARNGFGKLYLCSKGEDYEGEELIIRRNDVRATLILLENGYPREKFMWYKDKYPNSKVIQFLEANPVIHRQSGVLDPFKFSKIEKPRMKEAGFFNRTKIEKENAILIEDYEDRILAQKRFIQMIGEQNYNNIVKKNEETEKEVSQMMTECVS